MAFSLNSLNNIFFLAPYFVEIQRKSFLNLLNHGLIYELSKRSLIIDSSKKFKLIFYPKQYKLSLPKYTPKQAILKKKTYGSKLYIPLQLKTNKPDESYLRWVKVAYLPLMTKRGHFIINGSPRVIVNQLIRSPGIYYRQKIDKKKIKTHYADLISFRGAWLRLETDKKQRMWIRMKKTPKIPLLTFLLAAGASFYKIDKFIHYPDYLKNSVNEKKYEYPTGIQNALSILYELVEPRLSLLYFNEKESADEGKKFLFRKFFNPRTYDLSYLGRTQLNKKFQYSFPSSSHVLTLQDLLVATDYLIKLEYNSGKLDDIDHLKNRRVRASGELIQNQLGTGFLRLEKLIRKKFINKKVLAHTIFTLINPKPITGALREFFGSSPLSQFMDQTNPLAELTHKRRVSALGPGGINRETAGIAVRGIHPTHYGRVCPIETPEGRNAGLVNSLTTFARINSHGFLETPFHSVYSGQVQKYGGLYFFSAAQEEHIISAPGDLKTDYFYNLPVKKIPARENNEFQKFYKNKIEYMSISPIQMISIATSLIPFLEHDDGNRALMGSNMQRQAVPLLIPEKVIVGTGLEPRIISDSGHGIQAQKSGFVSAVTSKMITIKNICPIPNTTTLLDNIQLQKNFKFNSRFNFPFYWRSNFYKNSSTNAALADCTVGANGSLYNLRDNYTIKRTSDPVILKKLQNSLNEQNVNKLKPSLNKILFKHKNSNQNFDKKVKKNFLNKNIFKMYLNTKRQDILLKNAHSILLRNNTENPQLFSLNPLTVNLESSYKPLSLKHGKNTKFTLKFAQKNSFFFMSLKKHKKFLTKNFFYLTDLFFYKNFSIFLNFPSSEITSQQLFKTPFNSIYLNNKLEVNFLSPPNKLDSQQKTLKENWVGFKKIEFLQSKYLFAKFFIQHKNWSKFKYTKKMKLFLMKQNDFLKNLDLNAVPTKLFYKLHFIKLSQDINQQNYFYLNLVTSTFWLTNNSEKHSLKYIFEKKLLLSFNDCCTNKEKNFFDSKSLWYQKNQDIQTIKTKFKLKQNLSAQFKKIEFSTIELTASHPEKKIIYKKINKFISKKKENLKNKNTFNWNKIIILPNYKNNEFFKFNLFIKNRQKNIKNLAFVCHTKLLQREKFISKIHFLTLSQKNRKFHYKALQNLLQTYSNLFFTQIFLIQCINFIFIQTSLKKKIFKHLFFYTSLAWNTQCTQNFSYFSVILKSQYQHGVGQENIKKTNKSYKLILKSPYIKKNDTLVSDLLLHNDYYPNKIFVNAAEADCTGGANDKAIKQKNLFNKKSETSKFKSVNKKKRYFFYQLHGSKNNTNAIYSTLNKFRLYKKTQLRNQKKIVKKIVQNTTALNSLQIQNLNFSPQFYFLQENTNYFIQSYQSSNQKTCVYQKPLVQEGEWVQKGDLLTDGAASVNGELSLGKTILVAYMPWEGYNFEDAIVISERLNNEDIYTSIHIERYETEICETGHGIEKITAKIPNVSFFKKRNLDKRGVIKVGSWVHEGDILVGKVTPIKIKPLSNYDKLLAQIEGKPKPVTKRNSSLQVPNKKVGRVIHVEVFTSENISNEFNNPILSRVRVYIAEKRKLEVGDKMSGRHGNKGIISKIFPVQDMPYLPDGTPIDMILNPLGVPSRMNVGQIFECLLGLAGKELKQQFKISSFDEMNGPEASRSLTYSKLFEARIKTKKKWLFNPNSPGKMYLFDGRTGDCFHQTVTVGRPYILKLVHVVDEKIHARSTGPYSLVTQQPLRGRSKHGGQRLGEMEVWALEGFGAAYILQEVLTNKSDDMKGRRQVMNAILKKKIITLGTPEAFRVLLSELQSLCIDIGVYTFTDSGIRKPIHMIPRTMPKFIKKI